MTIKNNELTQEYYFEEGCYITELWNENNDPNVSIAQARVRPGESTKKHKVCHTTERYLILQGEATVHLGETHQHPVKKGDVVYIPADMAQSITNTGTEDLLFLAICSPRFKTENYQEIKNKVSD